MDNSCFVRADSSNLPKVDSIMLMEFMKNSDKHNVAEIRGVKALMSSRDSYVESAVGYVEVKRAGGLCDVKAKVVPEHKLSNKYYNVTIHLDDAASTIIDTECDGCAAAAGGCKHTLVVLYWLQKRSSEPSSTSVQCYWVKPSLKFSQQVLPCKELFKKKKYTPIGPRDPDVLKKFLAEAQNHSCSKAVLLLHNQNKKEFLSRYCLFDIMVDFVTNESDHSFENFKSFSNEKVKNKKDKISKETKTQVNSKFWHCIRQGRITGSKIYEIAHCNTPDGSLVQELLGGHKIGETKAMKRGKLLEKSVIKKLEEELNQEINDSGFNLINGIFGASPDGVSKDYVIEIKCPISEKTKRNYINTNGQICNKYMSQVQLEMLAVEKNKCLFCVADPNFEHNGKIEKVIVNFDKIYIEKLMDMAEGFWQQNIFPVILKSALM